MAVHTCNTTIQDIEAKGSGIQSLVDTLGVQSQSKKPKSLTQTKQNQNKTKTKARTSCGIT